MASRFRSVEADWPRAARVRRNRLHGIPRFALYIAGGWVLPGRKRLVPYSIQWLKRAKPAHFRQDLTTLLDLLRQRKIEPLVAERLTLVEARRAQELLGKGGVTGKIVLLCPDPAATGGEVADAGARETSIEGVR